MKKFVSLILTLLAVLSFAACGMMNDGYITDTPAATVAPSMTPAPGSGSVIDDSTVTSPSPMPTAGITSPQPTDAQSTDSPAASAKPSDIPAK